MVLKVGHGGAGDAIMAAWYWAGGLSLDPPIKVGLWGPNYAALLSIFGIESWPHQEGVTWGGGRHGVYPGYATELRIAGEIPRHEVWGRYLPIEVPAVRPEYKPDPEDTEWAKAELGGESILLFPNASRTAKTWPLAYWMELKRILSDKFSVRVVTRNGGDVPVSLEDLVAQPWNRVAALVHASSLVVCNVSGPMMLAGTLDIPTIAVQGPVRVDTCADHMPSVEAAAVSQESVACVGCHFSEDRGFRKEICRTGCEALMMLRPKDVAEKVIQRYEAGSAGHSA